MAILTPFVRECSWGAPSPAEVEHDAKAKQHFLKYCDSDKCIRGREYVFHSQGWHEGPCMECPFNPYNMEEPHPCPN